MSPREETVLKAMTTLAPIGALVPIASIHKAIGRAGKRFTDQALLSLAEDGIIALHVHDWPQSASRDERKYMLKANYGGKLYYFIGAAIREDQVSKVKKIIGQKNPRYLVTAKQKTVRDVDLGVLEDKSAAKALTRAKTIYAGKGYTGMKAKRRNAVKQSANPYQRWLVVMKYNNKKMGWGKRGKVERFSVFARGKQLAKQIARTEFEIKYPRREGWTWHIQDIFEIEYDAEKLSKSFAPPKRNPARKRNKTIIKAGRIDHLDVAKVHNPGKPKTGIVAALNRQADKLKRPHSGMPGNQWRSLEYSELPPEITKEDLRKARFTEPITLAEEAPPHTVFFPSSKNKNPAKSTRRKYRNGYIDLVIKGSAKKTAQGWKVGKKTIPQGKGIVNVSSGYYLDKATGMVFAKRARNPIKKRNAEHRDADHPIEVTRHWRSGPPGYLTPWQRARESGQKDLFDHGIKAAKKRNPAIKKASKKTSKRNPTPAENRREFAGRYSGNKDLFFPEGTPAGLSKLGTLKLIKAEAGSIKPTKGTVWLCRDQAGKLHIGTTKANAVLFSGSAQSLGKIKVIEYDEAKPHLGEPRTVRWFHKMGEETGERPTLYADGKGGLKIRGGAYRIESRGIVN